MTRRRLLAAFAIASLVCAVVLQRWWPDAEVTIACCWRGGAILAAAWLAYDDVQRLPNWLLLLLPVLLIVAVRWPRQLLLIVPLLLVWAVLRRLFWPRPSKSREITTTTPGTKRGLRG